MPLLREPQARRRAGAEAVLLHQEAKTTTEIKGEYKMPESNKAVKPNNPDKK